jgi:hypothetical protein
MVGLWVTVMMFTDILFVLSSKLNWLVVMIRWGG